MGITRHGCVIAVGRRLLTFVVLALGVFRQITTIYADN